MQAASSPYLPPPPQHFYQNIYHIQPLAPQDHELKRQYLALLLPQQVIEICLTFDVHVPPYIKSTIWPPDITAAIASLRKTTLNGDASASAPQKDNDKPPEPVMASLNRPGEESSNPEPTSPNTEVPATAEPQPPDKQPENSPATATAQTPAPPTPVLPATPAPPPVQQQLQYPHQPYGYSQHPPAAYPHAPYYPPPPGYPAYPPSYPHYPPPVPNGYPHPPPPPPPHPAYPPPPNPMYPSPHVSQPPAHQDQGSDDLPSYEEMLVEALQESTDPEGCAPKDLFTWMAARYPLQSNFRPSASQALQKAFKRGRLEKSSNGKYRLSASWEGGNTSRRTTRRPQTQSQSQSSAAAPTSASPFTHAPLVHHHHHPTPAQQNAHQPYPGQTYPYPYGGPVPPGYPGYPPPQTQPQPHAPTHLQPQPTQPVSSEATKTATTTDKPGDDGSDVDRDAYEAARNILKAINFGDLFQIAQEEGADGSKKSSDDNVSVDQLTSLLVQAQNAMSQHQQSIASAPAVVPPPAPVAPLGPLSAAAGVAIAVENSVAGSLPPTTTNVRAELQAQLALLAAQLADLGQEGGEGGVLQPQAAQPTLPPPPLAIAAPQPQSLLQQQLSAGSMAFEPPIMESPLPPPPQFAQSQPVRQEEERSEDIPIDPVLQAASVAASTPSVTQPTEIAQAPPIELPVPPVTDPPLTPSVAPPPPPPVLAAPESVTEPQPEPHVATPNFVEGEDDSDDEDMEEII